MAAGQVDLMSRPRNAAGQYTPGPKRSAALVVRCTPADLKRWQARAETEGVSLSVLARRLLGA